MRIEYVAKRVGVFLLIVWLAATINFFLPRLSGQDPVRTKLLEQSLVGGASQIGIQEMAQEYEKKFGLDKPVWQQYLVYLNDMSHFEFNYSIANYPRKVNSIIADGIPWTLGLLGTAVLLSFTVGTFLGAFLGWPRAPRFVRWLMPPLLSLSAIPFFLLGLILMYIFAFQFRLLPMIGGYTPGSFPGLNPRFIGDVLVHAILPASSIILVQVGGWALGMRGMMVTTQGEDYVTFADAKGLRASTVFLRYAVRNAILPQTTHLALVLGHIISGAVLVEVIFSYPGIGTILYQAIKGADFFLIQGVVFLVIVTLGLSLLILDILYPLLDPRISYRRA